MISLMRLRSRCICSKTKFLIMLTEQHIAISLTYRTFQMDRRNYIQPRLTKALLKSLSVLRKQSRILKLLSRGCNILCLCNRLNNRVLLPLKLRGNNPLHLMLKTNTPMRLKTRITYKINILSNKTNLYPKIQVI